VSPVDEQPSLEAILTDRAKGDAADLQKRAIDYAHQAEDDAERFALKWRTICMCSIAAFLLGLIVGRLV